MLIPFISLTMLAFTALAAPPPPGDFYSEIAGQAFRERSVYPMESPAPPILPTDQRLQWNGGDAFAPMPVMDDTAEELQAALSELRVQYEPFLRDLAPAFQSPRKRQTLSTMQFRMETAQDREDFAFTLAGEGVWEDITVPYYHGPVGPATAWYRTEVVLDDSMLAQDALFLHFNGADYYVDAFFNGQLVGTHEGMLEPFEFNVKPFAREGRNVLLVRVRNDYSMLGCEGTPRRFGSKIAASNSPGWDDPMRGWNCCPAGFGLNQDMYLETRSLPYINDVFPRPLLDEGAVELTIEVDLPDGNLAGNFQIEIDVFGQNFGSTIVKDLRKDIRIVGSRCITRILVPIPAEKLKTWDPQSPWLYQVQVRLYHADGNQVLDAKRRQFGMRSFEISNTSEPKGRIYLNGDEIRLRGTNTMGFLQRDVMDHDWDQLIDDLLLAKLTNMNFIRTTQRSVQSEVYDYADRLGMMMQADLPLFGYFSHSQFTEALRQVGGMERLLRSHPSVVMVTFINEPMESKPHAMKRGELERFFDAAELVVRHENPDRALKFVDGDYHPPSRSLPDNHCYNIWYHGHGINLAALHQGGWLRVKQGWMYGCGEFGAEGLDYADLMQDRYPKAWLASDENGEWTPARIKTAFKDSQSWSHHWDWYETQDNIEDWVRMSQEHQAWGLKLVTEAFRRQPRMNTFAVHLFIDAWPNGWMKAIMDCRRYPKPAWFAYRDALTPLAVQVRSDRQAFFSGQEYDLELWICNDLLNPPESVELQYQLECNGNVIQTGRIDAQVPSVTQGSAFQGFLPITAPFSEERTTFTVRVGLIDKATGKQLHEYTFEPDLFPALVVNPKERRLYLLKDADNSYGSDIAKELGIPVTTSGDILPTDTILVDHYSAYQHRREEIDAAVNAGARCVILEQPGDISEMNIGGTDVQLRSTRTQRWIVMRNTDHPWLKGSHHNDFKFWHEQSPDRPGMHSYRRFSADGFTPVLTQRELPVIAERQDGSGRWIIAQFCFRDRVQSNPAGTVLLHTMLFGE